MTPDNNGQNALSLLDLLLVRTGTAERELIPQSEVFACCSNSLSSLVLTEPNRSNMETRGN